MNSTSIGQAAESTVCQRLIQSGYEIIDRNWRRPACEIDIVARAGSVVFFVEVKHRSQPDQGAGLDYLTARKIRQLTFAGSLWCTENDWQGDWRLLAASVKAGPEGLQVEALTEIS